MTRLITTDLLLVCNQKHFSRTPEKAKNVSQRNNKVFSLMQKICLWSLLLLVNLLAGMQQMRFRALPLPLKGQIHF